MSWPPHSYMPPAPTAVPRSLGLSFVVQPPERQLSAAVVLVLFAAFLVGGVTFEHFYCPSRSVACADGSALSGGQEGGFRAAEGRLEQTVTWSMYTGGAGQIANYFTDYYCCCVHDFSRKHEACKTRRHGNGLQ